MPDYRQLTDQELTLLLKAGDQLAFTEIYQRYGKALTTFAAAESRLNDLDDAGDVLHDLFVWLWEERAKLAITGNLKNYLFTAIRNRIIDHIRKNNTRQKYADLLEELSYSLEQQFEAKELGQLLEHSLTDLPARSAEIYRLSRQDHLSVKEIAAQLGLSEQTVKNQLTTALKHLRQTLITLVICWISAGLPPLNVIL
jgi:RNA polymerase sigma-70 factor (family 1)